MKGQVRGLKAAPLGSRPQPMGVQGWATCPDYRPSRTGRDDSQLWGSDVRMRDKG